MFRPQDFFAAKAPRTTQSAPKPHGPILIDKLIDSQWKSKWDQEIIVPEILYQKFNVPYPKSEIKKQGKTYPSSLIDYIKRAYARCQNQTQRKTVETELRKIITSQEDKFFDIKWQSYPLPQIPLNVATPEQTKNKPLPQVNLIKKGQIRLPPSYNIASDDNKPSKAMLLAQKRLQKFEEKLKNQKEQEANKEQKEFFIEFRTTPKIEPPKTVIKTDILKQFPKPAQQPKPTLVQPKKGIQSKQRSEAQNVREIKKDNKKITKKELEIVKKSKQSDEKINIVAKRYAEFNKIRHDNYQKHEIDEDEDLENSEKIIGKNKNIEKPYLRITGRPNPDTVRPENILKKALKHFLDMYKKGCNYEYLISQLRSIRQDLTVQNIKNAFTVQVYEQNFKISLFENDVAQFKHLQTRIWQLYSQGLYYTQERRVKFISYQLLTLILEQKNQNLEYMMTQIPERELETKEIQNCLMVKRVLMLGNYRAFFDFYNTCDSITRCLLNHYIDKVRIQCLLMICRTCGQKISLKNISEMIAEDEDVLQAIIESQGGIVADGMLMLKPSYEKFKNSEHLASKKVTVLMD